MTKKTSKTSEQKEEKLEVTKAKKKKDNARKLKKIPRFLVRQLYRMQYGFTKLNVFVQIMNTVSLLLILFSIENFFDIKWWHILTLYVSLIMALLITVFLFEIFGAWHTEQKQIFRMTTGELWREQMELRSLLFAKYVNFSEEELDKRIEIASKRLFPDKHKN